MRLFTDEPLLKGDELQNKRSEGCLIQEATQQHAADIGIKLQGTEFLSSLDN